MDGKMAAWLPERYTKPFADSGVTKNDMARAAGIYLCFSFLTTFSLWGL
jgi:hypothetical protein